jgi:hypothetical protein
MRIETYQQRVLIADEGKTFCNYKEKSISPNGRVHLGINADASEWTEITLDEAERLQMQWEAEMNTEIE